MYWIIAARLHQAKQTEFSVTVHAMWLRYNMYNTQLAPGLPAINVINAMSQNVKLNLFQLIWLWTVVIMVKVLIVTMVTEQ